MIDIVSLGEILIDFTPNGTNEQRSEEHTSELQSHA